MDRSFVEHDRLRNLGIIAGVALLCIFWGYAVVVAEWNALFVGIAVLACMLILLDFRLGVVLLIDKFRQRRAAAKAARVSDPDRLKQTYPATLSALRGHDDTPDTSSADPDAKR